MPVPVFPRHTLQALKRLADQAAPAGRVAGGGVADPDTRDVVYVVLVAEPVPAAAGDTPGTAPAPLYEFEGEDLVPVLDKAGAPVERAVHNLSASPSATGYQLALQETPTGRLILASSAAGADTDGGGGGGAAECCKCIQGVPLPGEPTVCCEAPLMFRAVIWPAGVTQYFKYKAPDEWATDPDGFEAGPACEDESDPPETVSNRYRYVRLPSHTFGQDKIRLELVVDNGCPIVCAEWTAVRPLRCNCAQTFALSRWHNIEAGELPCEFCLVPVETLGDPDDVAVCQQFTLPRRYSFALPYGFTTPEPSFCNFGVGLTPNTYCEQLGGTYTTNFLLCAFAVNYSSVCTPFRASGVAGLHAGLGGDLGAVHRGALVHTPPCTAQGDSLAIDITLRRDVPGEPEAHLFVRLMAVRGSGSCAGAVYALHGLTVPTTQEAVNDLFFNPITVTKEYEARLCNEAFPDTLTLYPSTFTGAAPPPTSDGSCGAPCTTPTADPDPDPETTCCIDGSCFEDLTGVDCTAAGGASVEDCTECEQKVPCCLGGDTCVMLMAATCAGFSGDAIDAESCTPGICGPGACCEGESCSVKTLAECDSVSGLFQGSGTTCTPDNPCLPRGACCESGSCTEVIEEDCTGYYWGDDTECDEVNCDSGACCFAGECSVTLEVECNGTYLGDDTACGEGICDAPPGACCHGFGTPTNCAYETEAECDARIFTHVWMGAYVPCDPCPP